MEAYSWEIHPTLFGDFPANHAWLPEDICFSTRQTWYKRDLTNWMCLKKGWFCKKWQCWWRFLRGSSTWEIHGFPVILAAISSQVSHVFGQFQDYFPSSFYQFWENHGTPKTHQNTINHWVFHGFYSTFPSFSQTKRLPQFQLRPGGWEDRQLPPGEDFYGGHGGQDV